MLPVELIGSQAIAPVIRDLNTQSLLYVQRAIPYLGDRIVWGFLVAWVFVGINMLILAPIVKNRSTYLWSLSAILVGFSITNGIFDVNWDSHFNVEVHDVPYTSFTGRHIDAILGLKIGLQGFNVTCLGVPEYQFGERINYNEHFSWSSPTWRHDTLVEEIEGHMADGIPLPVLHIAEYFALDGEFIRWGRFYRMAGYYCYTFMWVAFTMWMIAVGFHIFTKATRYTGFFFLGSALAEGLALGLWAIIKPYDLVIPFGDVLMFPTIGRSLGAISAGAVVQLFQAYYMIVVAGKPVKGEIGDLERLRMERAETSSIGRASTSSAAAGKVGVGNMFAGSRRLSQERRSSLEKRSSGSRRRRSKEGAGDPEDPIV